MDETERETTHFRRKNLAAAAGADDLGASLHEPPPGASSWPYHYHAANAEAIHAGSPPGGEGDRDVSGYYRRDDDVDYWTDETEQCPGSRRLRRRYTVASDRTRRT